MYRQAELEAVLGEPPVAVNGYELIDAPAGRSFYDSELPVREEPIPGRPYWLMWRCSREGSGCWAIGDGAADTWNLVMLCAAHDRFHPYRGRRVTRETLEQRDAWIAELRRELQILDGLEPAADAIVRYGPYRLDLGPVDLENLQQMERVDVVLRLLAGETDAGRFGFSVANCPPQAAAIDLIAHFVSGQRVRLWPAGATEPIEATIVADRAVVDAFAQTTAGETIAFSYEAKRRFDRIEAWCA